MSQSKDQIPWKPHSANYDHVEDDKHSLVIVHYWAPWNPHDRIQDQHLDKISNQVPKGIIFRSWNVDNGPDNKLCPRKKILNIPALGRVEFGILKDVATGLQDKQQLIALINNWR